MYRELVTTAHKRARAHRLTTTHQHANPRASRRGGQPARCCASPLLPRGSPLLRTPGHVPSPRAPAWQQPPRPRPLGRPAAAERASALLPRGRARRMHRVARAHLAAVFSGAAAAAASSCDSESSCERGCGYPLAGKSAAAIVLVDLPWWIGRRQKNSILREKKN